MAVISAEIPADINSFTGTTSQENQKQYFHVTQLKARQSRTPYRRDCCTSKQRETKIIYNRIIGRLFCNAHNTGNDVRVQVFPSNR